MQRVTTREFQRNFGRFQDEAMLAPLSITRNGRERLVILSSEEHARLKRRDRRAISVKDLSDAEVEAILRAEPPPRGGRVRARMVRGAWRPILTPHPASSSATRTSGIPRGRAGARKAPNTASPWWYWRSTPHAMAVAK